MSRRTKDINGYWEIKRNPLTKAGVFPYLGSSIGAPEPNRVYNVFRPPEELSAPETLASARLNPIVDDHDMLGDDEDLGLMPAERKGVHGVVGEDVVFEDGVMYGNVKIYSRALKRAIDGGKRELSWGYHCEYDFTAGEYQGIQYDCVQRKQRGNHLALVDRGRMGPDVAVLDHSTFTVDAKDIIPMTKLTPLKAAQDALQAAKDANASETVIAAAQASVDAAQAAADEDDEDEAKAKAAKDAEEAAAKEKADKEAEDAAKKKAEDEAKAKATGGADAALRAENEALKTRIAALESRPTVDSKDVFAELNKRNALAERISKHVGSFDHAEMSLAEVAAYGLAKLEIKGVPSGHELTALDAYLSAKPVPTPVTSADAADAADSAVNKWLDPKAA